jgi:alpha-beta hydrolase superfamily lysophospholipase
VNPVSVSERAYHSMGNKVSPSGAGNSAPIEDSYEIISDDNRKIWCKQWRPKSMEKIRCAVYICHGLGEYCITPAYDALAKMFAQRYDAIVFANDHMGHGRSEGTPRAYTDSLYKFVDDMHLHIKEVYGKLELSQRKTPLYLFGHSMGGAISTLFTLKHPHLVTGGVMLMGPLFDLSQQSWELQFKYHLTHCLKSILPSSLPVAPLLYSDCVSEPEIGKQFDQDPHRFHGWIKMGIVAAMIYAIKEMHERNSDFTAPLFISHGTSDKLCCVQASKDFYEKASSKIKTLKLYEKGAHCLLDEYKSGIRDKLVTDIQVWMDARINSDSSTDSVVSST